MSLSICLFFAFHLTLFLYAPADIPYFFLNEPINADKEEKPHIKPMSVIE